MSGQLSRQQIQRRFIENSGLIVGTRVLTAALSLLTIPVVVARLGLAGYGTWEALLALGTLASMFQGAIGGALVWRVSEAFGKGDAGDIRRLVRVGVGVTCAHFLVLWPIIWALRQLAVQFLHVPPEFRIVVADMLPIVVALLLLSGLSEILEAVVSGCQRSGLVNVVGAAGLMANYSVVIAMTALGGGLWSLVAGQAAGFTVRFMAGWLAVRSAYGKVSLVPMLPRRADLATARYSGLLAVGSVAAALRDQTDKIVLASLASASWVGYYGIAARLSGLVMEIGRFFYVPMLTAVAALNAAADWDAVRRRDSRLMAAASVVAGLVVVVVAGLAGTLVVLWMGRPIPLVTLPLWLLIAGNATAVVLTGPGTAVCRGVGRAGIETTYLTCNLVLNLALTIVLVPTIGAMGTVVATGVSWALSSVLFAFVLHQKLDLPVDATRRAAGTVIVAAGTAIGVHWASIRLGLPETRGDALVSLSLLVPASAAVYAGALLWFRLAPIAGVYGAVRSVLRRTA